MVDDDMVSENLWDLSWMDTPFFMVCTMCFFSVFAFVNIRYAIKSKNSPEKKGHPRYFVNEMLVGVLFIIMIMTYPFLFKGVVPDNGINIESQIYYHIWFSLVVHIIAWLIYLQISKRNNKKHNRVYNYDEWKINFVESFNDSLKSDIKRKLMHIIPAGIIIGFHYLGMALDSQISEFGWSGDAFSVFMQVSVGIHFLWVMNIGDNLRLHKKTFKKMGKFAITWMEDALKPSELNTYSSANPMILTLVPFILAPPVFLFSAALIGSISDAAASIVGKKYRIPLPESIMKRDEVVYLGVVLNRNKSISGWIAGFITTYLIVILCHIIFGYPNASWLLVNFMAFIAASAFLLLDLYAAVISDNFYNPFWTGICLVLIYFIFI